MQKLDELLKDFPSDYHDVVAFYMARSKRIEDELANMREEKLKKIRECEVKLNEQTQ